MIEPGFIDSFHIMWDSFPEPVLLIHSDRTILAVNDAARTAGVPIEVKCFTLNPNEGKDHCRHCRGNRALSTGQAVASRITAGGKEMIAYWLPVRECDDIYVHFGVTPEGIADERHATELVSVND